MSSIKIMHPKYLVLIGFLLVVSSLVFLFIQEKNVSPGASLPPAIILLNEDGFQPNEITILKGQSVTFQTTRGKIFWPASDPHPAHDVVPTFDPLLPIEPNETWTYTFDEVGSFKFHDHLAPSYRGVVHVVLDREQEITEIDTSNCDAETDENQSWLCWDELMREVVGSKGVAHAMNLMPELVANPTFAAKCHSFTHTIGNLAFVEFQTNKELDISPNMNYCGFGFYHGFMEGLFERGGTIMEARELCEYVENKANNGLGATIGACFHGIGHGVVDGSSKRDWGDPQALVDPGLELCDRVGVTKEELNRCYSGAFNSISIAYRSSLWGLETNPDDPYKFCRDQKEQYKFACYQDMAVAVMGVVEDDFIQSIPFAEDIMEDEYAKENIRNLAGLRISVTFADEAYDYNKYIAICKSIQSRLVLSCIRGFGSGLIEFNKPESGYDRAVNFCSNESLTKEEKTYCFLDVLFLIKASETPDGFKAVCQGLDEKYRNIGDFCEV